MLLVPAPVANKRALAVGAIGGVIAPLAVVDQGAQIQQVVAVLGDGAGNQLARLGRREGWTFF